MPCFPKTDIYRTCMSKTMTTPSPPEVCPPIYYPPPSQPPHDNVLNWKPWKPWLFKSTILRKKQYTKFQFSTFIFVKNSCLDKLVAKGQKLTSNWHFCSFQKNCILAFVRKSCSLTGRENSSQMRLEIAFLSVFQNTGCLKKNFT